MGACTSSQLEAGLRVAVELIEEVDVWADSLQRVEDVLERTALETRALPRKQAKKRKMLETRYWNERALRKEKPPLTRREDFESL